MFEWQCAAIAALMALRMNATREKHVVLVNGAQRKTVYQIDQGLASG